MVPVPSANTLRVVHHERRPRRTGNFSLERSFAALRSAMADARGITVHRHVAPHESLGVLPRLQNAVAARRVSADVHHLVGDNGYLAPALPAARTILTVHDCIPDDGRSSWRLSVLRHMWIVAPARRAARVIAVSEYTRREVLRLSGIAPERVVVIPTVVPPLEIPPPRPWPTRPRVLQLGTASNKNIERLAAAMAGLDAELLVVGPLSHAQRGAIANAGVACEQHDALDEAGLADAYARSDVVAVVSTLEGFGMPVVEAQRAQRPVVVARATALPETAGDGATYVDPLDVASIRAGLLECFQNAGVREGRIAQGVRNAARFTAAAAAAAHLALYREVATAAG